MTSATKKEECVPVIWFRTWWLLTRIHLLSGSLDSLISCPGNSRCLGPPAHVETPSLLKIICWWVTCPLDGPLSMHAFFPLPASYRNRDPIHTPFEAWFLDM
jgi:hypothetical protein